MSKEAYHIKEPYQPSGCHTMGVASFFFVLTPAARAKELRSDSRHLGVDATEEAGGEASAGGNSPSYGK